MLPIRTIVHPTDFSENSAWAWELACALARDYNARLLLLHVEAPMPAFTELGAVPPQPVDREALERKLAEIQPTDARLQVKRVLKIGDEADEIDRFARENRADVIVMGTHGRTGLRRLLMGSVAEAVGRKAACPVLTVRTPMTLESRVQTCCEMAAAK